MDDTEMATDDGKAYLSALIDGGSGVVCRLQSESVARGLQP